MNGMTPKELEKEKMLIGRMCFELKAKRKVSRKKEKNESRILCTHVKCLGKYC